VRLQLVEDRQRERQPVQQRRVGGQHPQVAGEHLRLLGVGHPAQLMMPVDDVRVAEIAGEAVGVLEQDPCLLPGRRGTVDGGVLDRHQVVQRDQRRQHRLAVAPGDQDQQLALRARGRRADAALEGL
jgi:hypothetical protein